MHRESIRDRLARFLLLCSALASICFVVIVTQRLSDDALSLALGIGIGIVALLIPLASAAAILYLAVRWTEARTCTRPPNHQNTQPPIYLLPQPPDYQLPPPSIRYTTPATQYSPAGGERRFAVIGEDQ